MNLPAPLDKGAASVLPLRVRSGPVDINNTGDVPASNRRSLDHISIELGTAASPVAALRYERDVSGPQPRVLRGALQVGSAPTPQPVASPPAPPQPTPALLPPTTLALPANGVSGTLILPRLDLDAWSAWLNRSGQTGPVTSSMAQTYWPQTLSLAVDQLTVAQRTLHRLRVQAQRNNRTWRTQVAADELTGRIDYRLGEGQAPGLVFARLSHLRLERGSGEIGRAHV